MDSYFLEWPTTKGDSHADFSALWLLTICILSYRYNGSLDVGKRYESTPHRALMATQNRNLIDKTGISDDAGLIETSHCISHCAHCVGLYVYRPANSA